jgi:hypothetical protein
MNHSRDFVMQWGIYLAAVRVKGKTRVKPRISVTSRTTKIRTSAPTTPDSSALLQCDNPRRRSSHPTEQALIKSRKAKQA